MNPIIKQISENKKIAEVIAMLQVNQTTTTTLTGMNDSAKAAIAYALTVRSDKSSVIVCSNVLQAKKIIQDIKFFSEIEVLYFPARTLQYYEMEAESMEVKNQRMYVIDKILSKEHNIVVTTMDALLVPMYPENTYENIDIQVAVDDEIDFSEITHQLVKLGYEKSEQVEGKGQFAIRGGILDVFAINGSYPYRIELFGDTVDSIRTFDPLTQRSIDTLKQVEISFLSETSLSEETKAYAIEKLSELIEKEELHGDLKSSILEDIEVIREGNIDRIFDKYFKLFTKQPSSFLDYVKGYTIFIDEPTRCQQKIDAIGYENKESLKVLANRHYLYLPYVNQYMTNEEIEEKLAGNNKVYLETLASMQTPRGTKRYTFDVTEANFYRNGMDVLLQDMKRHHDKIGLLVFPSETRVLQIKNYLQDNHLSVTELVTLSQEESLAKGHIYVTKNILSGGFSSEEFKIHMVAEPVSGVATTKKRKTEKQKIGQSIQSFDDLKEGDYVVHENHGIGIYGGIETIKVGDVRKDYIKIEYANKGVLYVPINQLDHVRKYVCDDDASPKINSLNSKEWEKTKAKVNTHVKEIAKELVLLYAKREKATGFAFSEDTPWQKEFEDSFSYELTDDQKQAVAEIKEEMQSPRPMDRLLCGDVGYGKTEVALRAAFKAVVDGKQVAYLVPTTVLSLQQYKTFKKRMEPFGIRVEMLSRFSSPKEQKQTLKDVIDGKVDVVVGTHRLLSKDVFFKDLGLLIIDEEHRFGVKAKEAIKKLKENIDVVSMTATPIPRTLHMSMIGVRTMSTLTQPPMERLPVHTYVLEYDKNVVKEAIEKELLRDGQIIYLNNRVNDIEEIASKVRSLVPDARIGIAHGRMDPEQIENVMIDFMNHELDIIICTTILESGIDIANANTLVVENSDKLGLAQLYQIRGRVGRSNRLAYAYITYPKNKQLSEVSEKRLKAIRDFTEFGSGFKIALRDLEIRGAGNLLGREQHGHMAKVGYEMYLSLLEKAIAAEKAGAVDQEMDAKQVQKDVKIELNVSAYISDSYISNPLQKIEMYQKISDIESSEEVMDVVDELLDRYGEIPKETENLIKIVEIRNQARMLGIDKISVRNNFVIFEPLNLKIRLTNGSTNDILITVQLEIERMLKEKG